MTTKLHGLRQKAYAIVAVVTAFAVGTIGLTPSFVSAAQLTTRSIKLSNSSPGATGVTYTVTFDTGASAAQELVIDFCGTSPIINANCDFSSATVPNVAGGAASAGTFAAVGTGAPVHTIKVTGLTIPASSTFTIDFTGITNPSAVGTFFARILTYGTGNASTYFQANATGDPVTPGTYVDYGGIAMTTVNQVSITAKVQESLTFCASKTDISGAAIGTDISCSQATPPAVEIGHGTPQTLDSGQVDNATVYTQLSTNASSGVIVRMKATNACTNGGLSSTGGAVCNIPGLNTAANTPQAIIAGTANFGLYVSGGATTTGVSTSTGTVTPDPSYHDPLHVTEGGSPDLYYGMDTSTLNDNVTTPYGDSIMACTAPVSQINNHLVFGATASLTTQAGIYTGNEILIATGKF